MYVHCIRLKKYIKLLLRLQFLKHTLYCMLLHLPKNNHFNDFNNVRKRNFVMCITFLFCG